ncbi:MAG: MBL fold metallo-hydrolase [Desulfurococcaceae archaeon]
METSLCIYRFKNYLESVNIQSNGAIVIGKSFAIDGFAEKPIRIITHAHSDHLHGLNESLRYSKHIVATPITLDLIEALGYINSELLPLFKLKSISLNYHQTYSINDEEVEFYDADHIPGSVQVLVKIKDKKLSIGYTGDFKLTSKTEIMKDLDVLVIEATYGNPYHTRPFKESVPQILVDLVIEGLYKYKKVYIYAYHGKIQEAMSIIRNGGIDAPFILPDKAYRVVRVLEEKHGYNYGNYLKENNTSFNKEKCIIFKHFNSAKERRLDGKGLHIVLTGRLTHEPFMKVDDYTYVVSLSDHADFSDLVKYVEYSNPRLVIIDGSRHGEAEALKNTLLEKGFCSMVLPQYP